MTKRNKRLLWLMYQSKKKRYRTVRGTPPLTYTAKKAGTLKNYRIYGNTVDGESVGDRTGNLFKGFDILGKVPKVADGNLTVLSQGATTEYIEIESGNVVLSVPSMNTYCYLFLYNANKEFLSFKQTNINTETNIYGSSITNYEYAKYARVRIDSVREYDSNDIMLNSGSEARPYEPYGYRVPVTVEGKNLLPNNGTSYTSNAITATKNDDGSVTISNRGEERTQITWVYYNSEDVLFKAGTQICISTRHTAGISFKYSDNTYSGSISQKIVYTIPKDVIMVYSQFYINADEIHTLYPMIRKADIEDDTYEPYHEPITTNLYLPEQIRIVGDEAEYVDYQEQKQHFADGTSVDVELPTLPTIAGTNTLSVGTEVQPSAVQVRGRIKEVQNGSGNS